LTASTRVVELTQSLSERFGSAARAAQAQLEIDMFPAETDYRSAYAELNRIVGYIQ